MKLRRSERSGFLHGDVLGRTNCFNSCIAVMQKLDQGIDFECSHRGSFGKQRGFVVFLITTTPRPELVPQDLDERRFTLNANDAGVDLQFQSDLEIQVDRPYQTKFNDHADWQHGLSFE